MKLFRTETNTVQKVVPTQKVPVIEGWSEQELVAVYNAAAVRHLKKDDPVFPETEASDSFFVLMDGAVQVSVKWDGRPGRRAVFRRGHCTAPLPKSPGLTYCTEAAEPSTIIEIRPTILNHLPEKTQLSIYKAAVASTNRINGYIRSVNGEVVTKNALLATYITTRDQQSYAAIQSEFVQEFLRNMPRMPAYAMELAAKLLDDRTSVQEVVEGIKRDPSVAGIVLRTVNSASC